MPAWHRFRSRPARLWRLYGELYKYWLNDCTNVRRPKFQPQCFQSINQSCIFRVVQVTKSLQDPLKVVNKLSGIIDNVREWGLGQKCFRHNNTDHTRPRSICVVGSALISTKDVALRRARLVPGWVTVASELWGQGGTLYPPPKFRTCTPSTPQVKDAAYVEIFSKRL